MEDSREPFVIGTYPDYIKANLALIRLETEGIEAMIEDENLISMDPLYGPAVGGVKLSVGASDREAAKGILQKHAEGMAGVPVYCLRCDSTDVARGWHLAFFSMLLLPFPIGPARRWLRCRVCKHGWRENP